jgi:hypothetical protein
MRSGGISVCGQEKLQELFKEYPFFLNKIDEDLDTFGIIWDMIHSMIYSILRSKKSSVRGFDVKFSEQAQAQSLGSAEHPPECERNLWHQNGFCFFFKHWMGGWGG